jgi:aminobenzoyl-glutamate transport protein
MADPQEHPDHPQPEKRSPGADPDDSSGLFNRFLKFVEWLGNLLPHPVTLFALFALGVIVVSGIAEFFELSVQDPRPEGAAGRSPDGRIYAISLMNAEGLRRIVQGLVTNFTGFAPLGTVLVALLGVGVAERSGLIRAAIRGIVLWAANSTFLNPRILVTTAVVFSGIVSNTASELGYVVLVPLGAVVFMSMGRHPLAGLAAAFAGVSGGYSANLFIGTIDPLLAGLTQEAAQLIAPDYMVHAAVNWYFMFISVFLITAMGVVATLKFVEPLLGKYDPSIAMEDLSDEGTLDPLTRREKQGLLWAGVSIVLFLGVLMLTIIPEWGILRNPETGDQLNSPFFRGIVTFIFVGFIIPGFVYGRITGSMKGDRDIVDGMAQAMSTLGLYIVIVFFAAQFVAFFGWTNLGQIVAVSGAQLLNDIGLTGPLVFIGFIFVSGFVNLMLGSASAQWAVTAPIFVPMLMLIGYSPEVIQAAYRIGDSVTNIITPMMSYFGLILAFANRYDRNLGIGTVISMMIPYSVLFFVGWMALFYLWVFALGMPVGPGTFTCFDIETLTATNECP